MIIRIFDPTNHLEEAKRDAQLVPLPTRTLDIFDRKVIQIAKALFDECREGEGVYDFGFGTASITYQDSIECYFVDLHLSSQISIDSIERVLANPRYEKENIIARDFLSRVIYRKGRDGVEEALARDREVRRGDENAPLTHLVKMDDKDREIANKRKQLYKRVGLFALCLFVGSYSIRLRYFD